MTEEGTWFDAHRQALPALLIRAASPRALSALAVKVQYADQSTEALLLLGRAGKMHSPANTTTIARFEKAVDLARNEAKYLDNEVQRAQLFAFDSPCTLSD